MADGFIELNKEKLQTPEGITELNRMLQTLFENIPGDTNTVRDYSGYGVPTLAAGDGSTYRRLDGTTGATFYVMEEQVWTPK